MQAQFIFPTRLSFRQTMITKKCRTSTKENNSSFESFISSRSFHENDNRTSDVQSRNRERLVALFRRIQRSISEAESSNAGAANISQAPSDAAAETSVLQFLQLSTQGTKNLRSKSEQNEESTRKRTLLLKKEARKPITQPQSNNNKISRLHSTFVKRSPIPSPAPPRSINLEETNKEKQRSDANKILAEIQEMKLIELKELAKDEGIRGYSKLKKGELIELLRSHVNG